MNTVLVTGASLYIAKKLLFTRYINTDLHTVTLSKYIQNEYSIEFKGKYFDKSFIVDNISGDETYYDIIRLLHILKYKFKWLYRHRLSKYDIKLRSDMNTNVNGISIAYYYIPHNYKLSDIVKKTNNNTVVIWVDLD